MKYALVTGSTKGIGYAIAKRLINEGYFVFFNGRSDFVPDFPEETCFYIKTDVSTLEGVDVLVESVLNKTNVLDALVLNVGTTCRKNISDISYDEWQKVMDTNINMPFFIVQKLMGILSGKSSILFMGSSMGIKPHGTALSYGVSKSAVVSLTQNLVKELNGVRINCVCPGFVETEWQTEKPEWLKDKISSKIALKRFATPDEIADMCVSIMQNTYMNGSVVNIDGGYDME